MVTVVMAACLEEPDSNKCTLNTRPRVHRDTNHLTNMAFVMTIQVSGLVSLRPRVSLARVGRAKN